MGSKIYHVLNGDSLANEFPSKLLPGEIVVMREALIDGDLGGKNLEEFWKIRAAYLENLPETEGKKYFNSVVPEMKKIIRASPSAEFNLWFEYDLFCQINLWFILSLLRKRQAYGDIFIVYPDYTNESEKWKGFGWFKEGDLVRSYQKRVKLEDKDLQLADALWNDFKENNLEGLKELVHVSSYSFPYLKDVIQAHIDRFPQADKKPRPELVLEDIIKTGKKDFPSAFQEFFQREGIYGFGDTQLKKIYDKVIQTME